MLLQIFGESANRFQCAIKKLITFQFVHFGDEMSESIKYGAVHVVFVWIEADAVGEEISNLSMMKKVLQLKSHEDELTCINHEFSA